MMLPVSIITGFLGSGKTTLLNRLLQHESLKNSLVIINEFGEVGIDHLLVSAPAENMRLLASGCLCCEVKGDLVDTLTDVSVKRARGEIPAYDRVLIETLKDLGKLVTAAVKGSPVINDATLYDAAAAGLFDAVTVIDNGNDGIGTLLEACSSRFLDAYRDADLIICKGQANYETLLQSGDRRIFFLFKVKCSVVAGVLRRPNGDIVLLQNG